MATPKELAGLPGVEKDHRFESYNVDGPEGPVTIVRDIDSGVQAIASGEAMQRGDRPGVDDAIARMVETGQVGKDAFPAPMPEPTREPEVGDQVSVSHEDVATPDEVRRRSRQKTGA